MVHPAGCILGPSLRLSCILGVLAPGSGLLEGGKWFFFGSSLGSGGPGAVVWILRMSKSIKWFFFGSQLGSGGSGAGF